MGEALGVVDIIGLFSSVLGIVSFGQSNFASQDDAASETTMRIQVGLDTTGGLSNAGGDYPDLRLWNEDGAEIGSTYNPGTIKTGAFTDVKVDVKGQQPTYALFTAHNDAICIAYISQTWPDGQQWGWTGDWALCPNHQVAWYYSNIIMGSGSNATKVNCMWIDGNRDATDVTGFQVHFPEFLSNGTQPDPGSDPSHLCDSGPPFKTYTNKNPDQITYWILQNKRRNTIANYIPSPTNGTSSPRNYTTFDGIVGLLNDTRLIISSDDAHSAANLCNDPASSGPDFLNPAEGVFCCMKTKKQYPICGNSTNGPTIGSFGSSNITSLNATVPDNTPAPGPCFNLTANAMTGLVLKRDDPPNMPSVQGYDAVINW